MSLPDGFLDELRTRLSLAQVVGRKVVWDARKSNQGKGDWWAPCPFHQEKTASFHVDDRKGFYYCFGCHAKGDAIGFVRETENVGFMEAVEILAGEAGLAMPARDPRAQEKADRKTVLIEVMERAVRHYRLQLKTSAGAAARDYLAGRGLGPEALERWEIGFAPPGWHGLRGAFRDQGLDDATLEAVGLVKPSSSGREPYDTFRNRIMFPIRDARGRAIAFGGRAMDPDDSAKYLNSPETELFDKGRTLFNQARAREAAGKGRPLIVAEGYMDVIALAEAGFGACVAPLGTAVTEEQLRLLWRIDPEPVIALDGDAAGLRAGYRVMDLALPLIEAGQSLRFALLPEGQDPDDLLRAEGARAMQRLLDAALPMVRVLWRRETEARPLDSPERRAALDKALRQSLAKIADPGLRAHYGDEIRRLRRELFDRGEGRPGPRGRRGAGPRPAPGRAETRSSTLAAADAGMGDAIREAVVLATLVRHIALVPEFLGALESLELSRPEHEAVRAALLSCDTADEIAAAAGSDALDALTRPRHVQIAPPILAPGDMDVARQCVAEELARLSAARGVRAEVEDAVEDLSRWEGEGLSWRLDKASEAVGRATEGFGEDRVEWDTAPNGVRINRAERAALDRILSELGMNDPSPDRDPE